MHYEKVREFRKAIAHHQGWNLSWSDAEKLQWALAYLKQRERRLPATVQEAAALDAGEQYAARLFCRICQIWAAGSVAARCDRVLRNLDEVRPPMVSVGRSLSRSVAGRRPNHGGFSQSGTGGRRPPPSPALHLMCTLLPSFQNMELRSPLAFIRRCVTIMAAQGSHSWRYSCIRYLHQKIPI
jgi:hypothetical protein